MLAPKLYVPPKPTIIRPKLVEPGAIWAFRDAAGNLRILRAREFREVDTPRGIVAMPIWRPAQYIVVPGSQTFGTSDTAMTIPKFNTIAFALSGAGGGAGGSGNQPNLRNGTNGGSSTVTISGGATLVANGGQGGGNGYTNGQDGNGTYGGFNGAGGTASGGTTNTTGGGNSGMGGYRFYNAVNGGAAGWHYTGTGGNGGFASVSYVYSGDNNVKPGMGVVMSLGAAGSVGAIGYPSYTSQYNDRGPSSAGAGSLLCSWS